MLPLEDRVLLQNTLTGLNVNEDAITQIMSMLGETANDLAAKPVAGVSSSWFGHSHTGGHRLATNTSMAHQAVVEEMEKLVAGLRGYRDNIKKFADDVTDVDADAAAVMAGVETATACVAAPTFDGGQCSLPTDSTKDS
jgi:hypothetical protein